ncbi:MAG: hypothetical protein J0I57_14875 [Hyphomicrobium sp.]|uniref:hypothetical protein n=1 Tax=Hyphomicrobium sp. CS1BSMeth3 TaxID=1892844 RepID=UPI001160746B|nr:hypothetical protein [Hyphomicrobium sp. CS1BSMeth3]MBN9263560.1 hypothetical protein [Hyphomicrobium sp.]MBN9278892.1 hypothetical protein [Hyphomicrobium sp.]
MRLGLGLAVLPVLMIPAPASAHDWYPIECCSGIDCAPVDQAEFREGDTLVVTTKHGTGIVPSSMTRRESKDNKMHVCMRKSWDGQMRVICVFLPPPS